VFTAEQKPFEVELAVAEVGPSQESDHLYRLTFDGSIADENGFIVMGGQAEKVSSAIAEGWRASLRFRDAIRLAMRGLITDAENGAKSKALPVQAVEVAVLDRTSESSRGSRRAFRRLNEADITALLAEED
jgi:proteasome alpha subunit